MAPSTERYRASARRRLSAPDGERGFGLIGVIVFIAILGMASASVLMLGQAMQRRWAEDQLLYVGEQYRQAIRQYYQATPLGQPRYPNSLEALLKDPRYPGARRYLRQLYSDPITGLNNWVIVQAPEGGIMGLHSASEREPIKQGNFVPEYADFANKRTYSDWVFSFYPQATH